MLNLDGRVSETLEFTRTRNKIDKSAVLLRALTKRDGLFDSHYTAASNTPTTY
jgi:hypothetical protein